MNLIEIKKNTFDVILDLKYASEDNILGKKIFLPKILSSLAYFKSKITSNVFFLISIRCMLY